ncbi:hypothetical protein D3C78_1598450 [compost metagenome]
MVNSLNRLRHDTVISCYHDNRNISKLCTTSTHCCKCFVTWSIQECNLFTVNFNLIRTDMLSNTSSFSTSNIRRTNSIKQCCLTMVNVTHDCNNWRTLHQISLVIHFFNRFEAIVLNWNLHFNLYTEVSCK